MTAAGDASRRRRARRGRAYFVLATAAIIGVITSFFWSAHLAHELAAQQQQDNRAQQAQQAQTVRDLCGVIEPFASTPIVREGAGHPANAAQVAWHQRFVILSRQFHC